MRVNTSGVLERYGVLVDNSEIIRYISKADVSAVPDGVVACRRTGAVGGAIGIPLNSGKGCWADNEVGADDRGQIQESPAPAPLAHHDNDCPAQEDRQPGVQSNRTCEAREYHNKREKSDAPAEPATVQQQQQRESEQEHPG